MNGKIARIQDLLADGWEIEDIGSDRGVIEVLLARGPSRSTIVLDRQDAWDVLYAEGIEAARPRRPGIILRP